MPAIGATAKGDGRSTVPIFIKGFAGFPRFSGFAGFSVRRVPRVLSSRGCQVAGTANIKNSSNAAQDP
jgi:hypothetical protein